MPQRLPTFAIAASAIGMLSLTAGCVAPVTDESSTGVERDSISMPLLQAHNRYRLEVGIPQLQWSDAVAASAQEWANYLASTDAFEHSDTHYGENLWKGSAGAYSLDLMVDSWGDEKQYFIPNTAFPNLSTTGNWIDVGHYTQMIWRDTTTVGCGLATGNGWDVLVCQYDPPGNYQGQEPF